MIQMAAKRPIRLHNKLLIILLRVVSTRFYFSKSQLNIKFKAIVHTLIVIRN